MEAGRDRLAAIGSAATSSSLSGTVPQSTQSTRAAVTSGSAHHASAARRGPLPGRLLRVGIRESLHETVSARFARGARRPGSGGSARSAVSTALRARVASAAANAALHGPGPRPPRSSAGAEEAPLPATALPPSDQGVCSAQRHASWMIGQPVGFGRRFAARARAPHAARPPR